MFTHKILTPHLLEAGGASFSDVHLALTPGREVRVPLNQLCSGLTFHTDRKAQSPT